MFSQSTLIPCYKYKTCVYTEQTFEGSVCSRKWKCPSTTRTGATEAVPLGISSTKLSWVVFNSIIKSLPMKLPGISVWIWRIKNSNKFYVGTLLFWVLSMDYNIGIHGVRYAGLDIKNILYEKYLFRNNFPYKWDFPKTLI